MNRELGSLSFWGSMALVLAGVVLCSLAWLAHAAESPAAAKRRWRGLILAVAGGLIMGNLLPLIERGRLGEIGLEAYALGMLFAGGIFVSTFAYNMYFTNLPVQGEPVGLRQYFRGAPAQHGIGLLAGMVFYAGLLSGLIALGAAAPARPLPAAAIAIPTTAALVGLVWGRLYWKEMPGAGIRVRLLLALTAGAFLLAMGLLAA
jgi:glucose uptake protein